MLSTVFTSTEVVAGAEISVCVAINFSWGALNRTSHQQVAAAQHNWFVVNACFEAVSVSELVKSQRELFKAPDFLRKKHFLKTRQLKVRTPTISSGPRAVIQAPRNDR